MNSTDYEAILKQAEDATSGKEKTDCILTMLKMIGTNHLPCVEKKIKKLYWLLAAVLLAILFQDQISLTAIIHFITKVF